MEIDFIELLLVFLKFYFSLLATQITPSPAVYNAKSIFSKGNRQHSYTFGLSREAFQKAFIPENPPRDPAVPGPGAYSSKGFTGFEAIKWSMRVKPCISYKLLHV